MSKQIITVKDNLNKGKRVGTKDWQNIESVKNKLI